MSASIKTPPRIEKIKIKNFRVLRDVTFEGLLPLTVLLGANGSGKSTFFDVFAFLSDCFSEGLRRAIGKRGHGLKDLRSRDSAGPISFEIAYREGYYKTKGQSQPPLITYYLEIDEDGGRPVVAREWMRWRRNKKVGNPFQFLTYERGQGSVVTGELPEAKDQRVERALAGPDILAVSTLGNLAENPRVKALREFITDWHLSHLSSQDMRGIPEGGPQERLSKSGDNLVNVIEYLHERHPDRLEAIFQALRRRIPQIEKVIPQPLPTGQLLLMVKDAPFSEGIQARYASDGTMKLLAYLVQLHDPNPAPMIGIEEPENFLHPKLLRELAEECEQATAHSQLIVTTHSPFFINALAPRQVWAIARDQSGYTINRQVSAMDGVQAMLDNGAVLGDLWMEGYFEMGNP
ncbi:AAA family ATPase [Magnetospirillum sulfuroxidans]|uniref:AAA family ATPase n=1 Tax=Magnetospirillum sulfuroxidans TaxID=611300 RepID=UPI0024B04DB4|nr:AAA family ATPase [Magnetospirillum sulfuroxidans]